MKDLIVIRKCISTKDQKVKKKERPMRDVSLF